MPRALRHQYPGAVYHVMARGDGGKAVFETDEDGKSFLFRLGQVCESHGWRVHAWVFMKNHFHLLLETPEPNLVTGMKYLLGTFSQGWNARRARRGHVFQGRYKAVPVSAEVGSPYYFRIAADYIHLNPARAGLVGGKRGELVSYKWSSLVAYAQGPGPDWLVIDRLLNAFELAKDGRGRRAYISWLEKRAANEGGKVDVAAMKALQRGWYLGEPTFVDQLRAVLSGERSVKKQTGRDEVAKRHDAAEAEHLASRALAKLGLPTKQKALSKLPKGELRKIQIAVLIKDSTSVSNSWIAERMQMGHTGALSRLMGDLRKDKKAMKEVEQLKQMLKWDT